MADQRNEALKYAHHNRERFLEELIEFGEIPSISTDPDAKAEIERAATWVADHLKALGLDDVAIMPTGGHPVVYAELNAGVEAPTLLIYGHYDVQPADPLDLWTDPPFSPTIHGDNIFARGISDMKGQVLASFKAVEALNNSGGLPINIKFLIEGEEEIGSPNLVDFMNENRVLISSDLALNPDTGMIGPGKPTITYALRGLAYFELRVYGPDHDLHSGSYGGVVHNPAQALCELIAGMHDENGTVTLPGFYDRVRSITDTERAELDLLGMDEDFYLKQSGAPALWGEMDYSPVERTGARPTLEVNGLLSGFTGIGAKTVLPSWAMAKISTRLVPDQDPDQVHQSLIQYLEENAPPTVNWELKKMTGSRASISDRESRGILAMSDAMVAVWGQKPAFRREGGSVPVVTQFQDILGLSTVNCGFSLPDDNMHSPNEKLHLPNFYKGIDTYIHFFLNLAEN
jgi:acetylornithine deacetylase/succinyl-diaminopimelate desuccinylase-like protein